MRDRNALEYREAMLRNEVDATATTPIVLVCNQARGERSNKGALRCAFGLCQNVSPLLSCALKCGTSCRVLACVRVCSPCVDVCVYVYIYECVKRVN